MGSRRRMLPGLGFAVSILTSAVVEAQNASFAANPLFAAGLTLGGDSIAKYDVHLGDVEAGGTLYYYGGINLEWPARHFALNVQGGRFVTSVSDYEFEQLGEFERWPIELIAYYERKRVRSGLGIARHLSANFENESDSALDLDFGDATGTLLEFQYLFPRFSINARYVSMDYEFALGELSGDHVGGGFTWRFGPLRADALPQESQ